MNAKRIMTQLVGLTMSVCMLGASYAPALSDVNPSRKTIPITASLDSWYEVAIPAGISGDGALRLTQRYNSRITSDGDDGGTFYGYLPVSVKGYSSTGVYTYIECPDLEQMALKSEYENISEPVTLDMYEKVTNGKKAKVGFHPLTTDQNTIAETIWGSLSVSSLPESAYLSMGNAEYKNSTDDSHGVAAEHHYTEAEMISAGEDTPIIQGYLVRTVLEKGGFYLTNANIDFGLSQRTYD